MTGSAAETEGSWHTVIAWGLQMVNVVMVLLSVIVPCVHLRIAKGPWTRRNVLRVFLIYAFVFDVGRWGFLFGFIPHVFFADKAADLIGWPKDSGPQFEVGLHDGGWGILGFLCVFFGGGFWLATTIGWSFFMFGAAWGTFATSSSRTIAHPTTSCHAFTDAFIPVYLIGLLYAYWLTEGSPVRCVPKPEPSNGSAADLASGPAHARSVASRPTRHPLLRD